MAILLLLIIGFIIYGLGSWVILANVNQWIDMGEPSFWNIFWILLTLAVLVGGTVTTSRR